MWGGTEQQNIPASEFVIIPKMNGTNSKNFRKTTRQVIIRPGTLEKDFLQ